MNDNNIIKIQRYYRIYKLKQNLILILNYNLHTKIKFEDFSIKILKFNLINTINNFILKMNILFTPKIENIKFNTCGLILASYVIVIYDTICPMYNKLDDEMYNISSILIYNMTNFHKFKYNDFKKFHSIILCYIDTFKKWNNNK